MKMSELRKMVRKIISESGGTAGAVAGHTGRSGQDIDDFAAGPFKPIDNVTTPLRHQVDSSKKKRSMIPKPPEQKWEDLGVQQYDEVPKYAGDEFVNTTNKMKYIDTIYDWKMAEPSKDDKKFINERNNKTKLKSN